MFPETEDTATFERGDTHAHEEVYTRTLDPWRAAIRRAIVRNVEWESGVIASMQVRALPCPYSAPSSTERGGRCFLELEYGD